MNISELLSLLPMTWILGRWTLIWQALPQSRSTEKLEAMASLVPPTLRRGFRPPDKLLAMPRPKP
jgi:hypothetical protein